MTQIAHDTDARTGISSDTKSYLVSLNNHVNMPNEIVSLMAPSASLYRKHVITMYMQIAVPLKCYIFKPQMPISSCAYSTTMSIDMPHINPLQ